MDPQVSIIIPVYNGVYNLSRCLKSVLSTTGVVYEIIVIDDGSSDGSSEILSRYAEQYPEKFHVFTQENQGVAEARNRGIRYARAPYIMFVDQDDAVTREYVQTFFLTITEQCSDIVIGGYQRMSNQGVLYEMRLSDTPWSRYMIMAPWAKIYRRDFILDQGITFLDNDIGEDVYFNLQVIHRTDSITIIEYVGYQWWDNKSSVSNTRQRTLAKKSNVLFLLQSSYETLRDVHGDQRVFLEFYYLRYIVWYLLFAGRNSNYSEIHVEAERLFGWLAQHFPQFFKNPYISLWKPEGETWRNRIAVFVVIKLYQFRILTIFFRLYARGNH